MEMKEKSKDNDTKPDPTMKTDTLQEIMGPFGKHQCFISCLIFISKIFVAFHQMAIIFLAPKVTYYCNDIENYCPCDNPIYNTSIFTNTMIMEWDLICDQKWLASLTQTLFQLGTLFGSVFFGMAADRFGRKNPLLVAVILQLSAGTIAAFIPNYWGFTVVRFLIGVSVGGTMVTGFVMIMEFVGTQYRDVLSAVYQAPFNLGHLMLPLIGYFFRDYQHFQLVISCPAALMLCYFIFLSETPRWLIAMKRTDEAVQVLTIVAKRNNRPTENISSQVADYQAQVENHHLKKGTILDLFRTPNMRKNIICMSLNWLACSYCFYGVSQYIGQLSGDVFANVAWSAAVTLLGTIVSIPLMKMVGRKSIVIFGNYVSAFCLLILALVPAGTASVVLACIGVVSSFIVFVLVYLYAAEMFPTVVRNAAIGYCSMIARVGSMIAPFVIDLGDIATWLPPVVFAALPLVSGTTTFLLPETKGCALMTTLEEGEQFGKPEASNKSPGASGK